MNVDPSSILILRPCDVRRRSAVAELTFSEPPFISICKIGTIPKVRDTIAAFCKSRKISTVQHAITDM
jgi:hypothetical protein